MRCVECGGIYPDFWVQCGTCGKHLKNEQAVMLHGCLLADPFHPDPVFEIKCGMRFRRKAPLNLPAPLWTDRGLKAISTLTLDVMDEADRQMGKFGLQVHTPAEWAVIVGEESGEAMKELCEAHFHPSRETNRKLFVECIQAATLFLKIAEIVREP